MLRTTNAKNNKNIEIDQKRLQLFRTYLAKENKKNNYEKKQN